MLFIGYSSKDRYTIVEPILFHLKHLGLEVWYDFTDMFLGDNRYLTNFEHGIGDAAYIAFVISPNLFTSHCAIEELSFAKRIVEEKHAVIFPIFYQFSPNNLKNEYEWLKNYIYNEVTSDSGTKHVAYQIAERIMHDDMQSFSVLSIESLLQKENLGEGYVKELLECCQNTDERNYGVRMGLLYSLFQYLPAIDTKYNKAIRYIFSLLQMNENPDHLIYSVFEKCILGYLCCQLTVH